MTIIPYTESDEYQKEISEQYKKRIGDFELPEIIDGLRVLGFDTIRAQDLQTSVAGNMNATYLTSELVVKVSKQRNFPCFYSNKVVSDRMGRDAHVVDVLAYDFHEKTPLEILVMKRAPGISLLDDIFEFSEEQLRDLFCQVLRVVNKMTAVKFDSFGWLNQEGRESFRSFAEFLVHEFNWSAQKIIDEKLASEDGVEKIKKYFLEHIVVFDDERYPTIMHRDLHMGNFLHVGAKLTAIIDFDWSMRGPKMGSLKSLLSFIDTPSQFTEGSSYYEKYRGKDFHFLLPVLRKELHDLFRDKNLIRKLNLLFISDGIKWIAENWSQKWNEEMMRNMLANEVVGTNELNKTYYGKVLSLDA